MVKSLEDAAYIPTVIISRKPTGGGTTLEPLNLIGRKWKESFLLNRQFRWDFSMCLRCLSEI